MTPVGKGRSRNRLIVPVVVALTFLVLLVSNLRVFVVLGAAEAPTLLHHDRVLVHRAAYDLFLPFTNLRLVSWADPAPGDLVLCSTPRHGEPSLRILRVVAGPGDTVEIRGHRLVVNGDPVPHEVVDSEPFHDLSGADGMGEVVARETLGDVEYLVTYTPETGDGTALGPFRVPAEHYFLLGDHRAGGDNDAVAFGTVPRDAILGAYARTLLRAD